MSLRAQWLLVLVVFTGCQCRPGPVTPVELGLRVAPESLDFGRVLEGDTRVLSLSLTSTTRSAVTVQLSTTSPFRVSPATVEVQGASDETVEVRFTAGNGLAQGFVTLAVGERTALVPVSGTGVRPPVCTPSGECIVSTYSLEEDRCIETQAADDAPCDPASVCLEQGRCRAGVCLGVARTCDDADPCTDDACAMGVGCVYTPHVCPAPTAACQVAVCDSRTGCGFVAAPDLTACGPVDCVAANICQQGSCKQTPTPEGFPCSPAVACLPEATCQQQECRRVDTAEWAPDWSAPLAGELEGALAAGGPTLFFAQCVPATDGGVDAGTPDAGADAGEVDAGAARCALTSYTGTGFERFTRSFEDEQARQVVTVTPGGVLLWRDGGLEWRTTVSGALRAETPFGGGRAQLAVVDEAVAFVNEGTLQVWRDGGLSALQPVAPQAELAWGSVLFAWDADGGALERFAWLEDGGLEHQRFVAPAGQPAALSVVGATAVLGGAGRFVTQPDGGSRWVPLLPDAGFVARREAETLSAALISNVFFERCDGGACRLDVDSFDLSGASRWSAPVLSTANETLLLASLLELGVGDATVAVVRIADPDGGLRTEARLLVEGSSPSKCTLPVGSGQVEQVLFTTQAMVTATRRADGGLALESYPLLQLPVSRSNWPRTNGVGGTRSNAQ